MPWEWVARLQKARRVTTWRVAVLLLYEHWLVRPDDLSRVNQAFFQVNAVISIGLFAVILVQLAVAP